MPPLISTLARWTSQRRETLGLAAALLVAVAGAVVLARQAAQAPLQASVAVPAPSEQVVLLDGTSKQAAQATATFAGGCFWGVQAVFQHTHGVLNAVSGYAGGSAASATYAQVSGGRTGHAETVQITYDPRQISYAQLLHIFFSVAHDPTQVNRQGPDNGTEYRSVVFFETEAQRRTAQAYMAQIDTAQVFSRPIATQLAALGAFHPAEAHHQNYAARNPEAPYIVAFDAPKISALKKVFPVLFRPQPVLAMNH